jgi:hypothetical protein
MNTAIMAEWLEWFDRRMEGRKVLLLLGNFSAHECALDKLELKNVRVELLPANTMSLCQPCNQGIIYVLKGHYQQHFTHWCLEQWEAGKEPLSEVNLLMAICWLVSAWELDVKGVTLANCFTKSRVMLTKEERLLEDEVGLRRGMRPGTERVGRGRNREVRPTDDEDDEEATSPAPTVEQAVHGQPGAELEIDRLRSEIEESVSRLCQLGCISAALPADDFIAPDDKGVDDPDDDLVAHILLL